MVGDITLQDHSSRRQSENSIQQVQTRPRLETKRKGRPMFGSEEEGGELKFRAKNRKASKCKTVSQGKDVLKIKD